MTSHGIPLASNPKKGSQTPGEVRWSSWINNIRVLTLHPAVAFDSPLVCEMSQGAANFEYRPGHSFPPIVGTYEALSYTWGDPSPIAPIILDGNNIKITKNLDSALRHLRRTENSRRLWVDALCIKQDDVADKNCFIPFMHKIYATALRTVVWLGESSTDSDHAISFLENAASKAARDTHSRSTGDILRDAHNAPPSDAPNRQALANLGSRPWWTRVWVMQEIACSKKTIIVQCGNRISNWNNIAKGIHASYTDIVGMAAVSATYRPAHNLERALLMQPAANLLEALERGRCAQATDPRDKVFGVLHLPRLENECKIIADYNDDVVEVYTTTTRYLLKSYDDLHLLILCDHSDGPVEQRLGLSDTPTRGLPSWVPDWADRRPLAPLSAPIANELYSSVRADSYKVSHGLLSKPVDEDIYHDEDGKLRRYQFTENAAELKVKGVILSFIFHLGPLNESNRKGHIDIVTESVSFVTDTCYDLLEFGVSDEAEMEQLVEKMMASQFDSMLRCLTCDRKCDGTSFEQPLSFEDISTPDIVISIQSATYGRRLCRLRSGHLALVPRHAEDIDEVALILGCPLPVVLRRLPSLDYTAYTIVGFACESTLRSIRLYTANVC
jgi:hypothetical protein